MAFKTKKLLVGEPESDDLAPYNSIEAVPGIQRVLKNADANEILINQIRANLAKPRMVAQMIDTMQPYKVARERGEHGDQIIALHGYKVQQHIGDGKDGKTYVCTKYLEQERRKGIPYNYLVKSLSPYAQGYNFNSVLYFNNLQKITQRKQKPHGLLDQMIIKGDMHYRLLNDNNELYKQTSSDINIWRRNLCDIADLNYWLLKNMGCAFWDLGYGNGKNYMQNTKGQLKWVDYGGAGIVHVDKSRWPSGMSWDWDFPVALCNVKKNLVFANSDFLQLQFLFHCEYWYCKSNKKLNTNANLWSSNIQLGPHVLDEIKEYMMPHILQWDLTKKIYKDFGKSNWCDYMTWKKVRDYLR
tara:strand:- start:838 stop:1905 length:1068 start_codon:yes stop_codon:yes gene_type:complete